MSDSADKFKAREYSSEREFNRSKSTDEFRKDRYPPSSSRGTRNRSPRSSKSPDPLKVLRLPAKTKRKRSSSSSSSTSSSSSSSDSSSSSNSRKRKKSEKSSKRAKKSKKKSHKKKSKKESKRSRRSSKDKKRPKIKKKVSKEAIIKSNDLKSGASSVNKTDSNSKMVLEKSKPQSCDIPPPAPAKSFAPMTKEEWEKRQSVIRREVSPTTGRSRLIKGDGEVIEEVVSRQRHKQINKAATVGDGTSFQAMLNSKLNKR